MPCCCTDGKRAAPAVSAPSSSLPSLSPSKSTPARSSRLIATLIQWALPIATLALIPKCPICVAAYVFLFTGIGLSLPAATAMRWTLIGFSIAILAYLLFRTVRRALTAAHN